MDIRLWYQSVFFNFISAIYVFYCIFYKSYLYPKSLIRVWKWARRHGLSQTRTIPAVLGAKRLFPSMLSYFAAEA